MAGRSARRGLAAVALAVVAAVSFACGGGDDEDCDREDLAKREAECGYYSDGAFVLYPWVKPGVGGHPPKGSHPVPPAGRKPTPDTKPKPASTTRTRHTGSQS